MNSTKQLRKLFDIDIYDLLDEVFKMDSTQKTMIEFNQDQLLEGKDALERVINTWRGTPYRPYTIFLKKKKSPPQPTNVVTLKDTGDFYKTFQVKILKNGYEIIADFNKPEGSIFDNFDSHWDFLGLDDESATELVYEHAYPLLSKLLKKKLGI